MTTSVSLAQAEPTRFPMSLANPLVPAPPITALSPGMECFAWIRDLKDALADRAFTARGAGGLTLTATSPVPSGVASKAVLSQPACGTMLLQPSSASTSTQPITAPSRPYHQSGGPHPHEISLEEGEGACSPDNVNTSYTISAHMMMTPSMVPSSSPSPPCPISYASVVLSSMGGALSRRRLSFQQQRHTSRPPLHFVQGLTDASGVVAALVNAMYLGHPIHQIRPFPPTLYQ